MPVNVLPKVSKKHFLQVPLSSTFSLSTHDLGVEYFTFYLTLAPVCGCGCDHGCGPGRGQGPSPADAPAPTPAPADMQVCLLPPTTPAVSPLLTESILLHTFLGVRSIQVTPSSKH